MKVLTITLIAFVLLSMTDVAPAAVLFADDFENGVRRNTSGGPWHRYGNAIEWLQFGSSHNHTPGGSQGARAWEANPHVYNSYADFGATGDAIEATVYLYEDMNLVPPYEYSFQRVTAMLSLWGDSVSGPEASTDYLQIGLAPWFPGGGSTYSIRTKYNDDNELGMIDTGVARKDDWLKLTIQVDSMSQGGEVRFFIDDTLVGTSQRSSPDLRWVMLGGTTFTYENYWYDDVRVTARLAGDFNSDGVVNLADYTLWRDNLGSETDHPLSWNGDGVAGVSNGDYQVWKAGFGTEVEGPSLGHKSPVPEPATTLLFVGALGFLLQLRRECP